MSRLVTACLVTACIVLLLSVGFLLSQAEAATITYKVLDEGEGAWVYSYTISDYTFYDGYGFKIFFDYDLYSNIVPLSYDEDDWNVVDPAVQPAILLGLKDPGEYDAQSEVNNASLEYPFTVQFDWLGTGTPGSQPFDIYDPSYATIEYGMTASFTVPLEKDWNLISFAVDTCWYVDNPPPPSVPLPLGTKLQKVNSLNDVLSSIDGQYIVVMSFDAKPHTFVPDSDPAHKWNDMDYLAPGYGYWIKMKDKATLKLEGQIIAPSATLSLQEGWNLVGCWADTAYYDTPDSPPNVSLPDGVNWAYTPSLQDVLSPIDGHYIVVTSFDVESPHTLVPDSDPAHKWNNMHYIAPGYGYWIKMTPEAGELHY